jgi:medium-chain acyl-[acyl-carrier-protein] hydrolase
VSSRWFVRPDPRPRARLRLFCFPYAGVGASVYRPWFNLLPPEIELCAVQPPGREARFREPPFQEVGPLVDDLSESIEPFLDRDFAFFGHSMGACVAYELTRRLRQQERPAPRWLFASGRRAPGLPNPETPLHTLSDPDFIIEIRRRYNGIPDEVMQYPELMELLLPGLRADIAAIERHSFEPDEPLECPILALGGTQDPCVAVRELDAWRDRTTGPFALRLFPGDHFYLQSARDSLLDTLVGALRSALANPEPQRTGA